MRMIPLLTALAFLQVITEFGLVAAQTDLAEAQPGRVPDRAVIKSRQDIAAAHPEVTLLAIRGLPLADYPALSKFKAAREIGFTTYTVTRAESITDAHLQALVATGLTNIMGIVLTGCRKITDDGIRSLVSIPGLRILGLEETSITDTGLAFVMGRLPIVSISVSRCAQITMDGLRTVARSRNINEMSFSAEKLSQQEVLELIGLLHPGEWCQIVDSEAKLNETLIQSTANAKHVTLVLQPRSSGESFTNALQKLLQDIPALRAPRSSAR